MFAFIFPHEITQTADDLSELFPVTQGWRNRNIRQGSKRRVGLHTPLSFP